MTDPQRKPRAPRRRASAETGPADSEGAENVAGETGPTPPETGPMPEPVPARPPTAGRRPGLPTRTVRAGSRRPSGRSGPSAATPEERADESAREPTERERTQEREALALAHRIVALAEDRKAADIVLLSVAGLTTLTDYFVICSGGSERQLGAIADGVVQGLKAEGLLPIGREGATSAHWVLLDYGSVIVHVMAWPERDFYALEKLWSEAPLLLRVQ